MPSLLPSLLLRHRSLIVALVAMGIADRTGAQDVRHDASRPKPVPIRRVASRGEVTRGEEAARGGERSASRTAVASAASGTATDQSRIRDALREYHASGVARPIALGGAVAYPFGHGTPLLTCAVLHVCVVELERGEAIVDEPLAGDQARWIIQTARAGPGGRDALVVVKPKACDLATNLVIPTDRRLYDLSLESAPCDVSRTSASRLVATPPTRRVLFYYPDAPTSQAATTTLASETPSIGAWPSNVASATTSHMVRNDHYRVVRARRGPFGLFGRRPVDFPWLPRAIVDDGERVYVVAPPEARSHGAPVLYALEDDGSRTIVNVAVRGDTLVSDRTFRRGVLVLAAGSHEQRLTFENRAWGKRAGRDQAQTTSARDAHDARGADGGGR